MGRRRFRLGDMMPNSWFYKLRDMRRARGRPPVVADGGGAASAMLPSSSSPPPQGSRTASSPRRVSAALPHRTSYYYPTRDRELPPAPLPGAAAATEEDRELLPQPESPPPTCSSRRHRVGPVSAGRGPEAVAEPHARRRRDMYVGRGGGDEEEDVGEVRRAAAVAGPTVETLGGKVIASETDIVIDLRAEGTADRVLRPIVTRPARKEEAIRCAYEPKDSEDRYVYVDLADTTTPRASSASEQGGKKGQHHPRRSSVSAGPGRRLRTRANSPRLASSTTTSRSRRKSKPTTPAASPRKAATLPPPLAESFAVVKASADPRRDFRESMEEMIAEKGIRGAADLEDLLACYLALNAAEHHDLIVEVFEQIWASLAGAGAGVGFDP